MPLEVGVGQRLHELLLGCERAQKRQLGVSPETVKDSNARFRNDWLGDDPRFATASHVLSHAVVIAVSLVGERKEWTRVDENRQGCRRTLSATARAASVLRAS